MDRYNASEALNVQLGQAGYDYVTNTTVNQTTNPSTTWVAIQALSVDAVISATSIDTDVWDTLSSVTVLAGQTIYGRWSVVTVASGDFAIAYRG
jgi:hypothetical protein